MKITIDGKEYTACTRCKGTGEYDSYEYGGACFQCYGFKSVKRYAEFKIEQEKIAELREAIELKQEIARCYKMIQAGKLVKVYRTKANEAWAKLLEKSQRMTLEEIKELADAME